jgi:hypothetical protein
MRLRLAIALLVVVQSAFSCEWAVGYFHQVSSLKGRIVGRERSFFNPQWLRHRTSRPGAALTLYRYEHPWNFQESSVVARATADADGNFGFGALAAGHYTLRVSSGALQDSFDIEIVNDKRAATSVLIDISPAYPDCTGGHELMAKAN